MTLPLSRDITLALGTQIPSTLLNNLQDQVIDKKHGSIIKRIAAPGYASFVSPSEWIEIADGRFIQSLDDDFCHIHLPLETGQVLTALKIFLFEGVLAMSVNLRSIDWTDNTEVSIVTLSGAGGGGFIQLSPSFSQQTQTENVGLVVRIGAGQINDRCYGLTYTYQKP